MGILSKGSYARYRVDGGETSLPGTMPDWAALLMKNVFRPIEETSDDEVSIGWVPADDPFSTDFMAGDFLLGDFLVLSLRIDTRSVSPQVLKYHAMEEEKRVLDETGREKIAKNERKEIRERVRSRLLRRTLPGIRTFDMIWSLKEGEILFSSTADKVCQTFAEIFELTFKVMPVRQFSFSILSAGLPEKGKNSIERASPARFA